MSAATARPTEAEKQAHLEEMHATPLDVMYVWEDGDWQKRDAHLETDAANRVPDRPWKQLAYCKGAKRPIGVIIQAEGCPIANIYGLADAHPITTAACIVKAVNAHDSLVEACELALEHEECVCEDKGGCLYCVLGSALAGAEEEAKSWTDCPAPLSAPPRAERRAGS